MAICSFKMLFSVAAIAAVPPFSGATAFGLGPSVANDTYTFSIKQQSCGGVVIDDYKGLRDSHWKFEGLPSGSVDNPQPFTCDRKTFYPANDALGAALWEVGVIYPATDGSEPKTLRIPGYTADGNTLYGCIELAEYSYFSSAAHRNMWTPCNIDTA